MKRFIGIPNQFKGVGEAGDESIFSIMIDRNASGFLTIFSKAEDLFRRLSAVLHQHKVWNVNFCPSVIIFHLIELVLNVQINSFLLWHKIKIWQTREPELRILIQPRFMPLMRKKLH